MIPVVNAITHLARRITRSFGVDLVRYPHPANAILNQRSQIMQHLGIDLVFDVGANAGQFGQDLRAYGYRGDILSFEPQRGAYQQLRAAAKPDPHWKTHHFAFGEVPGTSTINLSKSSLCSSLLPMLEAHLDSAPQSGYVGQEKIEVRTLNDFWEEQGLLYTGRRILLKMDVQGFEKYVLAGATKFLPVVNLIEVEMSLIGLYDGEMLYPAMTEYLVSLGFPTLLTLIPGHCHPETGRLLQFDGLFGR